MIRGGNFYTAFQTSKIAHHYSIILIAKLLKEANNWNYCKPIQFTTYFPDLTRGKQLLSPGKEVANSK